MTTPTQMRRVGWTKPGLRRAMRALFALTERRPTKDALLARALLATIDAEHDLVERFLHIRPPAGPLIPDGLEEVSSVLASPGTAADHLRQLQESHADPVPLLIQLVVDLAPRERWTRWTQFPPLQRAAIEALAECHTVPAMAFVLRVFAWGDFEEWDRVVTMLRRAESPRLIELTLAIWPRAAIEVRAILADVMAERGVRDERVPACYRGWIDEARGWARKVAVDSSARLGDPEAGPAIARAFDEMVDDDVESARRLVPILRQYGLAPTDDQQRRLDEGARDDR